MAKQKRSFFERLTGIKKIEEESSAVEIRSNTHDPAQNYYSGYDTPQEDTYEFPSPSGGGYIEEEEEEDNYYQPEPQPQINSAPMSSQDAAITSEGQLTIDVYQTDDDIVIKSTIAGVKPEDLDVHINNDMVTIRGERKQEEEIDAENFYYQECYWGQFSRSVILPVEIIADKAEATMKNGILTIRLPKADTTKTRRIQVRGF